MRRTPHQIVDGILHKMAERGEIPADNAALPVQGQQLSNNTPASVLTQTDDKIAPVPEAIQEAQKTASSFYILKKLAAYSDAMNATNDASTDIVMDEPTAFAGLAGLGALGGGLGGGLAGAIGTPGNVKAKLVGALAGLGRGSVAGLGIGAAGYGALSARDAIAAGLAAKKRQQG